MPDVALFSFGDFELSARRRTLTHAGRRLRIGSRAMDILLLLAARAGELVTKDEIQSHVWPGIFVDEASVRVHLSSLRKALGAAGADYIQTVAGRGYVLTPPVMRLAETDPAGPAAATLHLPLRLERLIGRETVVDSLFEQVPARRFVTIVGPGGIGKTSVALEVATRLADQFPDGLCFVDLAILEDPEAAPGALAIALGLPALSELSPEAMAKGLAGKRLLVVLDNCERLAELAASLSEALLRSSPGLCVLATSREALRAQGEWLHRLPPLATPTSAPGSPDAALRFSAVELFVDRADAASGGYHFVPEDCDCVVEICRRLDGLPLAIELAATTVPMLGVRGVAAGLDDRLNVLTGGRRTAQSRHQTLRAALDWSYDLLAVDEQQALKALSVITGRFTLELAGHVTAPGAGAADEAHRLISALAAKSLIAVDTGGAEVTYRLLESTRAYAAEKLSIAGDADDVMRRYAEATLAFFGGARAEWAALGAEAWLARHASRFEDARAVLEWGFSGGGRRALARELTAAASEFWLHMGLVRECLSWCRRALGSDVARPAPLDAHAVRILHAFSVALGFTNGNDTNNRPAVVETAVIARQLGDHDYSIRALWALTSLEMNRGALDVALSYARELHDTAAGADAEEERLVGERLIGSMLHLMGRHAEARPWLEQAQTALAFLSPRASTTRFQFDQLVLTQGFLAWLAWLEGDAAQAQLYADAAVSEAISVGHPFSQGFAIDCATTLAIVRGSLAEATRGVERLGQMAPNIGFDVYMARREILGAVIQVKAGDLAAGLPRLRAALVPSAWSMATYRTPLFLAHLAEAELAAGQPRRALSAIDDAIAWFGGVDDFWCAPECFRVKAEVLRQGGAGPEAAREAERLRARAQRLAETQGAEAWLQRMRVSV